MAVFGRMGLLSIRRDRACARHRTFALPVSAGPLFAVGVALVFSGLYRACTGARLFATGEDWASAALGVVMVAAGVVMAAMGM